VAGVARRSRERGARLLVETGAQALRRQVVLGGDQLAELQVDAQLDAHALAARGERRREGAARLGEDDRAERGAGVAERGE